MDEKQIAVRQLEHGAKFPYDGDGPAIDWAHAAARGVLADLCDRRGVKHELREVDDDVRVELVASIAAIIRAAAPPAPSAKPVAWMTVEEDGTRHGLREWRDGTHREVPLYMAPPDHREVMRYALDALKVVQTTVNNYGNSTEIGELLNAIVALRAALEGKR